LTSSPSLCANVIGNSLVDVSKVSYKQVEFHGPLPGFLSLFLYEPSLVLCKAVCKSVIETFKDDASFCHCSDVPRISGLLPTNTKMFLICSVYDCAEKADLCKGYQNPKRKLGVTTHFSEIVELKFGKKLPYILGILNLFLELWLPNYSEKCVVSHIFLFRFQKPFLKSAFSP